MTQTKCKNCGRGMHDPIKGIYIHDKYFVEPKPICTNPEPMEVSK